MFYSSSTGGFYAAEIHGDGMPPDIVEISAEDHAGLLLGQTDGKVIRPDATGFPVLEDRAAPAPLSTEQIEALRQRAYAHPQTGSDRYFSEVARLSAMGGTAEELALVRQKGMKRYEEIRARYPWETKT